MGYPCPEPRQKDCFPDAGFQRNRLPPVQQGQLVELRVQQGQLMLGLQELPSLGRLEGLLQVRPEP